jgi:hypothetical protein
MEVILSILCSYAQNLFDFGAEDVFLFKQDIESCIKYLSRMRGKRNDSLSLAAYFEQLLADQFPEFSHNLAATASGKQVDEGVTSSSRKRLRVDEPKAEPRPSVIEATPKLTTAQKVKLLACTSPQGNSFTIISFYRGISDPLYRNFSRILWRFLFYIPSIPSELVHDQFYADYQLLFLYFIGLSHLTTS